MTTANKIAKNTSILFVSQIISYALSFFITIFIARYLGAEGFGTISFAIALCGILIVFTELGLSTYTVREVSRDKSLARKYSSNSLSLKIILSLFTFALIFLIVTLKGYPQTTANIIYLIGIYYILGALSSIYTSIFQAFQQMEIIAIGTIISSMVMFIGVITAIYYNTNIVIFALIYLLSNLIIFLYYLLINSWRLFSPKIDFDWEFWKFLIKKSLPFAMVNIFALIAFRIDAVILSFILGDTVVGWYSASYNILMALLFIPAVYATSILPVFSKFHVTSKDSLKFGYVKSFKYLSIVAIPIAVGTTFLAKDIILSIYSNAFTPSIIALQILIWAVPTIYLGYLLVNSIIAINKQNELMKILFFSMILNIVLNLIFIPKYSYIAASIITVLTELFVFILYFRIMSLSGYKISLKNVLIKPIIASAFMALFIISVHINLILTIIISIIIYFIGLILLKEFSEEDINLFRETINR